MTVGNASATEATPSGTVPAPESILRARLLLFDRDDVPVSMGIAIDNSGSMRIKREKVETAVLALLRPRTRPTGCSSSVSRTRCISTCT
ncbi:MAG TPA: hypothetical protein VGQ33_09685 [Vicinamibacteria bacterium]|nr:hypothetical protein [Vicinamibacteria bacterium]